ncbi:MAG: hypothetical protein ACYDBP_08995 [Leptospirales bacterium]
MKLFGRPFLAALSLFMLSALLPSCQTTPAVTYLPPKELPPSRQGIPVSGIVSDLRGGLLAVGSTKDEPLRVAVIRYTTPSGLSRTFGRYLSQKVGEGLSRTPGVALIDPGQVYEALHRLGIQQGLLDTKSLLAVGDSVGANLLVVGTYTDLGQEIDVESRILSLPDGRQKGLFSRKIPKTPAVLTLIKVGP